MNGFLRSAKKDLNKLKKVNEDNEECTLIITIDFGRKEDSPKPSGYPSFMEALESLGGQGSVEDIIEACKISGISEHSVRLDDDEDYEPIVIKVPITKEMARRYQ